MLPKLQHIIISVLLAFAMALTGKAADIDKLVMSGKQISIADGLSSNTIYDMLQDRNGHIWFGANYGLCRYDGYDFINHYSLNWNKSQRSDATIGNIYEDKDNALLWIHTSTFSFACYDLKTGHFVDYTGKDDEQRSYRRFVQRKDEIWMYDTENGIRLVTYRNGKFKCTDFNSQNSDLPSNHVTRLISDGEGNIWAITGNGLARISNNGNLTVIAKGKRQIDGNTFEGNIVCIDEDNMITTYMPNGEIQNKILISAHIGRVNSLKSQFIWQGKWMLFSKNTIAVDLKTGEVAAPSDWQVSNGWLLDAIDGYFFESNKSGILWIFPPKGKPRKLELIPDMSYTAERNRRYNIERREGLFYIATYGNGLFVYDYEKDKLKHFTANDEEPVLANNYLLNIMADRDGGLWISQESAGVACITITDQSIASFVLPNTKRKGDLSNFIRMVKEDGQGKIILSTSDNKLYSYDTNTNTTSFKTTTNASVYSMLIDNKQHSWMATRGDGLFVNGNHFFKGGKDGKLPTSQLHYMVEDNSGRVWITTYEDGLLAAKSTTSNDISFTQMLIRNSNEKRQHQCVIDDHGRLWVATYNGIYMVDTNKKNIDDNDFRCYNTDNSLLPFNEVKCLTWTKDGKLWTGGKGSGAVMCVFDKDMNITSIKRITTNEGLASNSVSSIIEDDYKNIWVATENGLAMISTNDFSVRSYYFSGNIERNCYSECCAIKTNGNILLGTRYGLNIINTESIKSSQDNGDTKECHESNYIPAITNIAVNGIPATDSCLISTAPIYTKELDLDHDENSITLNFSAFNYSEQHATMFQYYLEGVDNDWRQPTSLNKADYNDLAPGKYVFHLRSLCHNKWSQTTCLTITIKNPWYLSWWAWTIYIIAICSAALYVYKNAKDKLLLHEQMKVEKQMTEFRLNFYTNITHEFRTPLAIIQGAINKLQLDSSSKAAIQTAQRGTKRLMKMVNQLMEFRKINTGNLRLCIERDDIICFVQEIYHDLWSIAEQKNLRMTFMPFAKHHEMFFDKNIIETIVYNILSNAIKYTPEKGDIKVAISTNENSLLIKISDNGPGISKEQEASLFQPFMQGQVSKGGMGIGLYTAHRMAKMHHGNVEYKRENDTSIFTVNIPINENEYNEEDYKKSFALDTSIQNNKEEEEIIIREPLPDSLNNISITIIEDDHDMMEQICSELGRYFRISRFFNGQSALEKITESASEDVIHRPSLIICDVMLPDMEGYDIVKQLKSDTETADIPVIMLTALNDEQHQLKCYEAGGDDYMVKPCNFKLLLGRAIQLIKNYSKLASANAYNTTVSKTSVATELKENNREIAIITSAADKYFIEKLDTVICKHINDSNLNVEYMAEMMGMGRTKFFNKTKELTGLSPNKYLLNKRMTIAAELLKKGELTIAEISYNVGIQDASYFNKCFKAKYGVVPSKFAK